MRENMRLLFLSEQFYNDYPAVQYPEIEQKPDRPYMQVCIEIDGITFAIPFRSHINHNNVFWTNEQEKCGLDFTKAVVLKKEEYIDSMRTPYLRPNEFDALRGKSHLIKNKMRRYVKQYKNAKLHMDQQRNRYIVQYSTLQYFEGEIGL